MTLIEVKNLNKIYGSGEAEVKALKNINLNIEQGEFVAIVGQSGSGKSTLLHLLGGVDKPSDGEVIIKGKSIYKLKEKELSILRRSRTILRLKLHSSLLMNLRKIFLASVITYTLRRVERILQALRPSLQRLLTSMRESLVS